jgi:Ca-activated chloride channel family protein
MLEQPGVTPPTIARGVRVQVEFNPAVVSAYRLIGYENRVSAGEDFNPDSADAGDVAAGQAVTALYEVIPVGAPDAEPPARPKASELRYQRPPTMPAEVRGEMLTVKVRYREPGGKFSRLLEFPLTDRGESYAKASDDFKFAAAVASFGMILRGSPHRGTATLAGVAELAQAGLGRDEGGYRAEFIGLVQKTRALSGAR